MEQQNSKEPIRLRRRTIAGGRQSLYLDIYINGRRSYEYLKLYLVPEKTKEDREANRKALAYAEAVRAQRIVDLQNGRFGFVSEGLLDTNFLDYYRHLCQERFKATESKGNWGNWYSCLKHLEKYCPASLTFRDVTPEFCQGFRDYLDKRAVSRDKRKPGSKHKSYSQSPLSANSKQGYFAKFKCCIRTAYEEGVIPTNPCKGIKSFPEEEVERAYLTLDEVRAMAAVDCKYPDLKRAFLFSCLTGLRKSDIEKMTWKEVRRENGITRIVFKQKKTKGQEYLDISPQAEQFLGEPGGPDEKVFPRFKYDSYMNLNLQRWAMVAGVSKDITFHSGRHTFAVLMLDLGADIYTLQKLLGHRELRTTQIYANLMDKKKQEAVARIPEIKI